MRPVVPGQGALAGGGERPLLTAARLCKSYGARPACRDVSLALYPGEVLAVAGESGSGKTTLLNLLCGRLAPDRGQVLYRLGQGAGEDAPGEAGPGEGDMWDLHALAEAERRRLARTDWGYVHHDPAAGLRMAASAGANIGERLMAGGARHYGRIRAAAQRWLDRVEIGAGRIDDLPSTFSSGMRQRLQIACNLVTAPRLVFMDEPTAGLDVSVQARLLDLLRGLVADFGLAVVLVTHDLAVARLMSHRMIVMKDGAVVEAGLTDRVLDDPQHAYTQRLVASILPP